MATKKYLDSDGVSYLWTKIKNTFLKKTPTGSAIQGIFINSSGEPEVMTHKLELDVSSTAKLTDTVTTVTVSGDGNAITDITDSKGALTATRGLTFLTSHQSLANYYTKDQVNSLVSGALHYKGSSNSFSALTSTVTAGTYTPTTGDVWNIKATGGTDADGVTIKVGDNVAYNGSGWDVLGGTTDLSSYLQTSDIDALSNSEIDTAVTASA